MPGSPDDWFPPEPSEVFIVGADGSGDLPPEPGGRARPPGAGPRRWAALAIAGVLIFGLGMAVGTHIGDGNVADGRVGVPGASTGASDSATDSGSPSATAPPARTDNPSPPPARLPAQVSPPRSTPNPTEMTHVPGTTSSPSPSIQPAAARPWPTANGACGAKVPVPLLSHLGTLDAPTGLQLLAGNDTRRFDVDTGMRGAPLFPLQRGEFVSQLAVDGAGVVAVISDCRGYPPVRVVRRSADGTIHTIGVNRAGYQVGSLLTGGNRIWISLYHAQPDSVSYSTSAVLLRATDGSSTVITLPDGFDPVAGSGNLIVGNWSDSESSARGPIQLYSLSRRAIVAQLGGSTPSYVVANGYIVWLDDGCELSCPVHRYRIRDGATTTVDAAVPPSTAWVAISPDGTRIAGVRYDRPANPRFTTDHPGGPTGIVMMDLRSGTVTALPGIELAPKANPSLAFSNDSRWLVVGVDGGRTGRVLLYDRSLTRPLDTGVTVPGPVLWNIPIAVAD